MAPHPVLSSSCSTSSTSCCSTFAVARTSGVSGMHSRSRGSVRGDVRAGAFVLRNVGVGGRCVDDDAAAGFFAPRSTSPPPSPSRCTPHTNQPRPTA